MPGVRSVPVHLLLGDEEFLVSRAVREVVDAARAQHPDVDVADHHVSELSAGKLAELLSPSLFGDRRVVVVRDAQDTPKDLTAALLAALRDQPEEITVVITHAGGAKGKAVADGVRKAGARVLLCARVTKYRDKVAFVRGEIARHGGACDEDAAARLLDAVGSDLRELSSVCSQLVADNAGSDGAVVRVDAGAVGRYHRGRAEVTGFAVADAVMVGDAAGALAALRWALSVGVDPVPIADALADGVRTVARVSANRGNAYQIAGGLGMPPWKVERAQRQAKGWAPAGLADAMRLTAELNAAVKGGAEDRGYALESAVVAMTRARGRR